VFTGINIAKESGMILPGRRVLLASELKSDGSIVWLNEEDKVASLPESLEASDSDVDLAMRGSLWEALLASNPEKAAELADHIRVFGRCTPHHKVSVVTNCIDRGYITLMCGDGGNDCGALKTAHVGIALSDAEASVVSPFTSLDKSITSVVAVVSEGRCALASALASYKFMIMYGTYTSLVVVSRV
jgi:magnesium-transporting ATPase (P-type)